MPNPSHLKFCSLALIMFASWAMMLPATAQNYRSMSCGDLWHQRNAIYARNGFCFRTDRAIRVFGNENCRFDVEADVPMSSSERLDLDEIKAAERRKGCHN